MKRKAKYKKKAELGIQEALLNSSKYTDNIANSSEKIQTKQTRNQGIEDTINSQTSQFASPLGGKLGMLGNTAGNAITDKSFKKDGSVKGGQYALGKSIKYGSTGAQIGSNPALMAATGGLSAPAGAVIGATLGAVSGAKEASNINYQAKETNKQQKTLDKQLAIQGTLNDRIQANQAKDGKSSIHIKPENKGKFTEYKKRTGKTTEEALHSKNPHVRQMANFARNAKKFKHKEGTREIETEGREPIFSPKKEDGSRDILYYNPNDPKHSEGGVKAKVVSKSNYKMKSGNKQVIIPEGSAIITAKGGKNKEALKAYKTGDKNKLEKIINSMPEDKTTKKDSGTASTKTKNPYDTNRKQLYDPLVNDTVNSNSSTSKFDFNQALNKGIEIAPAAYNIGKGLFGKVQKTERNYYNPDTYKYRDSSDPLRKAAQDEYLQTREEIRRGSHNASSYLANAQQAANQRYKRKEGIETNEAQRKTDVYNQNTDLRNQAGLTNLNLKNQYNDLDLQNKARKDDYLGKGLEQASSLAQMNTLNKNRGRNEDILTKILASKNYKFNKNTGDITSFKSGTKNVKPKYKKKK